MQRPNSGDGPSPWHAGQLTVQARAGVADKMSAIGKRVVRPFLIEQHRDFFTRLPFLVVGSVDGDGWPWASTVSGAPGFISSPTPHELRIAIPLPVEDPLRATLNPGAPVGLLGIDLWTRRRNRVKGRITAVDDAGCALAVEQSFGNCAMYIQRRETIVAETCTTVRAEPFAVLDDAARALIRRSDTCFIASCTLPAGSGPDHGADVSHRGGRPGFVGLDHDDAIVMPDYAGNNFFNTLGNLTVTPRAGLLFIDFLNGDLLQVTGTAEILWEGPEVAACQGAERLCRIRPARGRWLRGGFPLRMELCEPAPHRLGTGSEAL